MKVGRRSNKKMTTILRSTLSLVAATTTTTASSALCFPHNTAAAFAPTSVSNTNMNNVSLLQQQHYCRDARSKQYTTSTIISVAATTKSSNNSGDGRNNDDDDNLNVNYIYRLLYFNSRGSAEVLRYYMHIHNIPFQDVRYPITATSQGFGTTEIFQQHQMKGVFDANMGTLPILQIIQPRQNQKKDDSNDDNNDEEKIIASIGQTYAILRYLDSTTHINNGNRTPDRIVQHAHVDSFVECIRDVKSAWFRAKKTREEKQAFLKRDLKEWCMKLENSLPPQRHEFNNDSSSSSSSPSWLFGSDISVADIALYAMMSTSTSTMTGSTQSFFDNATYEGIIQPCLENCPRLIKSIYATSQLEQVQQYELHRPDTFS